MGVCCDLLDTTGATDEGVVGCVDMASERASEVCGVGVCTEARSASAPARLSSWSCRVLGVSDVKTSVVDSAAGSGTG